MTVGITATGSTGFCTDAWAATATTRAAIDALPFVVTLGDGSLDHGRFAYYLAQDTFYLDDYARALAAAAVKAPNGADLAFFAKSAHTAIEVEQELHRTHVQDLAGYQRSPTCVGYTSYLLGVAHTRGYAELVAALLPCFWIYQDVGTRLLAAAGDLTGHPYGDWIGTYADEEFARSTVRVCRIADRVADGADPATLERMHEAFARATAWEWMFWDAAWRQEGWPAQG
ncbi:TenA family protein [Actinopolymorpha rutila]|uniref:Thiaminase/transcriptional activator TenA n=1 Tax=Actinopolymorpha rutila TaxID=446787 RepID=A0A852ZJE1_9ACTN|nr:TenA family protein [Actinopolymorpha rutila]NYH89270.1 thiaminase/transcriptional activator TenA [Actinopolymorpha rutila]